MQNALISRLHISLASPEPFLPNMAYYKMITKAIGIQFLAMPVSLSFRSEIPKDRLCNDVPHKSLTMSPIRRSIKFLRV